MSPTPYFPSDEFVGRQAPNLDLAADYLELKAIFSEQGVSFSQDIVDAMELSSDGEFEDVDTEIRIREEVAAGAIARMSARQHVLSTSYPFEIDGHGDVVSYTATAIKPDLGQAAYLVSLILSNLRSISPLLDDSSLHPSDQEVRELRQHFQYFATAAIAGEVGGPAWSFGFPRPDGTGFLTKLSEIWRVLKDGRVGADPSAPPDPKDDKVDIFAWREQRDGLPGFLLAAAQVATGNDWKDKSIKSHIRGVFPARWFQRMPATEMVAYHVIPFARPDNEFRDDVLVLGNVLHRLRVPRRVTDAAVLARNGVMVEALDQLAAATQWLISFVGRVKTAT